MLVVLSREVAIILRRGLLMTGGTLRVDIERASRPARCVLTAVATEVRTGATAEAWRAAILIAEAGRKTDFSAAVIVGSATMAGVTARGHRTKTECVVFGMGLFPVRSSAAVRRFAVTGAAVRVYGLYVGTVTGRTRARLETRLQIRNAGGMTEVTIVTMGDLNRRIGG